MLYSTALGLASPYLIYKAATRPRHVRGLRSRLGLDLPQASETPCIWVHGVSVGEIKAAKTFIDALSEAFPQIETVLSTTTSTGQEVALKEYEGRRVFYFPADFSWSVSRVFDVIKPCLIVLMELELWPNFLEYAKKQKVPVAVVNGRISERSTRRFVRAQRFVRGMFENVDRFVVQTEAYAQRFASIGVAARRITVTGNLKYDNLKTPEDVDAVRIRERLGIAVEAPVLIGGSTHPSEERALLRIFQRLKATTPALRLILVPRHNERAGDVEKEIHAAGEACLRFSQLDELAEEARGEGAPVILVDVMGELGRLYAVADLCFVGGSLIPHGGQNMLEPASLGKAVVVGPHCHNFPKEVDDLLSVEGIVQVSDEDQLGDTLAALLEEPERARALGRNARQIIERNRGATRRTIEVLSAMLDRISARRPSPQASERKELA